MSTGTARTRWLEDGQLKLRETPMIYMYHGVADVDEDPNQLCVSPARFAEQMAWLARRGLRGVGIAELVDAMRAGRQRAGPPAVLRPRPYRAAALAQETWSRSAPGANWPRKAAMSSRAGCWNG